MDTHTDTPAPSKPLSASSRPRRSIVPPARMASPPPPLSAVPPPVSSLAQPSPMQPSVEDPSSSSSEAVMGMTMLSLPRLASAELAGQGGPPVSSSSTGQAELAVSSEGELTLPSSTPVHIQGDDDMCPSCLGPIVPSPPGGGTGDGNAGGRARGKKATAELLWIGCEGPCEGWFHYACVRTRSQGLPPAFGPDTGNWKKEVAMLEKWFCPACASPTNQPVLKPGNARKSARPKPSLNYAALDDPQTSSPATIAGVANDWPSKFAEYERQGKITLGGYLEMTPEDVTVEAVNKGDDWERDTTGLLRCPVVVRALPAATDGERSISRMGGLMPPSDLTVRAIAELNGRDTPVEVVDVASQGSSKTVPGTNSPWTLGAWADYYDTPVESKKQVFNIISYEISGTLLAQQVRPPKLVTDLDWVDRFWPTGDKMGSQKPKVQLYCLMSPGGCFTDWHVDFAGSSVYYHILKGSKVFWFISPTKANLDAYARWSDSSNQETSWLGDKVDKVTKIVLNPGDTMIIPAGVIHAVYTPSDSLVFGGNFLHSYDIKTQIRMRDIEIATKVPQKFRFPRFARMCWYVADHYNRDLQSGQKLGPLKSAGSAIKAEQTTTEETVSSPGPSQPQANGANGANGAPAVEPPSPRLLDNLACLASFLVRQIRHRERGTVPEGEKGTVETIPRERVKDASCLARELRWRVKVAQGYQSDDEDEDEVVVNGAGKKGKGKEKAINGHGEHADEMDVDLLRAGSSKRSRSASFGPGSSTDPKPWDACEFTDPVITTTSVNLARPGGSAEPVSATLTKREDFQVQTRQTVENDGRASVEIRNSTRSTVTITWEPPAESLSRSAPPPTILPATSSTETVKAPAKKRQKKATTADVPPAQSSPAGPSGASASASTSTPKTAPAPKFFKPSKPKAPPAVRAAAPAPGPASGPRSNHSHQHQQQQSHPYSHPHHPHHQQQPSHPSSHMEQGYPVPPPPHNSNNHPHSQTHQSQHQHSAPGAWLNSPSLPSAIPTQPQGVWPPFGGMDIDQQMQIPLDPTGYGMLGGLGGAAEVYDDGMGGAGTGGQRTGWGV